MNLWFRIKYFFKDGWCWIESSGNRFLCRRFGHPKPYVQRISCETCPRCFRVMQYTGQRKINVKYK